MAHDSLPSDFWSDIVRPRRIAFVGQELYFGGCALTHAVDGYEPVFIDFRDGDDGGQMAALLHAAEPDVAFVFKPEVVPPGVLSGVPFVTVGYATEPLPSLAPDEHPDLVLRRANLSRLDPGNFDRLIVYNPGIVASAEEVMPVWRCVPLPVDDRYYRDVELFQRRPRAVFVGRSTAHREQLLLSAKHHYDVAHIAHGAGPDDLDRIVDAYDIGINLHNEMYPNFENRVAFHLAAGHLVLSEPLSPTMGLEPGIDYIEFRTAAELAARVGELIRSPGIYHRVRVRGRDKAELFRASRVYPALADDVMRDVATFGTDRGAQPLAAPPQIATP
jgi:hypothetical protein